MAPHACRWVCQCKIHTHTQRHLEIGEPETDDCTLTRKQRASQLLSKKVPPQTVYNLLCAYKDSVKEVSGAARMANHHTKWRKKQRRLLTSQIQWEVHWAPIVLESWEKSIAIDSLGYKPALMRPATAADMQNCRSARGGGGIRRALGLTPSLFVPCMRLCGRSKHVRLCGCAAALGSVTVYTQASKRCLMQ